jgi:hypothetical protein
VIEAPARPAEPRPEAASSSKPRKTPSTYKSKLLPGPPATQEQEQFAVVRRRIEICAVLQRRDMATGTLDAIDELDQPDRRTHEPIGREDGQNVGTTLLDHAYRAAQSGRISTSTRRIAAHTIHFDASNRPASCGHPGTYRP